MHPEIDQIIRSNRRTFSLEIQPDGRLLVRAPKSASDAQIRAIVARKADWIAKGKAKVKNRFGSLQPKTFTPGERFWYLGEQYPLHLTDRKRPPLDLDGAFLLSRSAQDRAKEVFIEWYREETRRITRDFILRYTAEHGFKVNTVRITSARTRWGSCSGKRNLNFTYRLSMAPLDVVEYVVVHELAHLKVHNHGRDFWRLVSSLKPDYTKNRAWLKQHGALLTLD
ncbi:MAG: SprT family zinc-dependent metalloprotease [Chloroflexota bacterium]|nr:SprT family zinc-dependent metalloprotease [Chloroflexota bacterium]